MVKPLPRNERQSSPSAVLLFRHALMHWAFPVARVVRAKAHVLLILVHALHLLHTVNVAEVVKRHFGSFRFDSGSLHAATWTVLDEFADDDFWYPSLEHQSS